MSTDNKQVIEELKKRHHAEKKSEVDNSNNSTSSSSKGSLSDSGIDAEAIMQQLAEMKSEVSDLRNTNNMLVDENDHLRSKQDGEKFQKQQTAVSSILNDDDHTKFVKSYTFPAGDNPEAINFKVVIRFGYGDAQGKIAGELVTLTNGQAKWLTEDDLEIQRAYATFRVLADQIPSWLKNPEENSRVDILLYVYEEYLAWANSFREQQTQ